MWYYDNEMKLLGNVLRMSYATETNDFSLENDIYSLVSLDRV